MGDLVRLVFMVVMLVAVALAATLQQPEWANDLGLDQWMQAILTSNARDAKEMAREFERRDRVIQKRIDAKDACIRELIAGRLTLFEAAAQFRRVNEEYPVMAEVPDYVSESPDEQLCRQVIRWAQVTLRMQPSSESAELIERLERDLRRRKQSSGVIVLPETF